ncbi:Cof-type HAD-IIB family hydrolase [Propionicicella superfundia]|uniref:Cof-type HAD-IIB family hydrolase n=1 Tax=Propionicicella superfundia TaxID=348582 RepID=UPI0004147F6E|nr:Cof-type HAD-IIB family hydrolase [Propionicicella superfundia]
MVRKAVFLDVDGTLLNEHAQVPASAARAVREARACGHRVFLCTGRCMAELWPGIRDIGFDGYIFGAGAYVQVGDEVVAHRVFADADVRHAIEFFGSHGTDIYLEANDVIYATAETRSRLRRQVLGNAATAEVAAEMRGGPFRFLDHIVDPGPLPGQIMKIMYFGADVSADAIRAEFAGTIEVLPSSTDLLGAGSGELMIAGVHKAIGMHAAIAHLGVDRVDTIAIGDSYNDLEMLEEAAVGIAMGNAPRAVMDVADEVTATPDEDGLWLAFLRHGLVSESSATAYCSPAILQ